MKIFALILVACLQLAHCEIKFKEDELIISEIESSLESLNSSQCKSDLSAIINGYRNRKAWAIASKRGNKAFLN